jgi:hypothetical protein
MWFMPSYGRPERLRDLLDAPGGWPSQVNVLVNKDDPARGEYEKYLRFPDRPWILVSIPAGSRCADAHRFITSEFPGQPFYGLLCDDHWPVTPGWWKAMEEAAGDCFIVVPNGEPNFPLFRNAGAFGGGLVRAMGSLVPCAVKHNFEDNLWDTVAKDFGILKPLPDVFVEHKHWRHGTAKRDMTYERGSADFESDRAIFQEWMVSNERAEMSKRVGKFLGVTVSTIDPKKVKLYIVVPIGDEHVDVGYHKSLNNTMVELAHRGFDCHIIETTGGSNVGKAREKLLWDAWRKNPTHIMFIDADMGWETDQIVRLITADHEFSCVVGVRKADETKLCCNFFQDPQEFHPHTKFLKIKDVGFAFVLLKASVIEKMCKAYPALRYNAGDNEEYALFIEMIDKREGKYGERLSEDFSFCRRWLGIGGEIWCDPEAAIIHAGRKEYTGKVSDVFEIKKPAVKAVA